MSRAVRVDVVVPTIGRPSLDALLASLAADGSGPLPERIVLCDDRRHRGGALTHAPWPAALRDRTEVVATGGRGPAAARNAGWRRGRAPWVAFLDDDVLVPTGWLAALQRDLADLPSDVVASQGRIEVPQPADRRPTDWERNVAGLEEARWATADMAYRRSALTAVGGFDERFPRAYREDADLGLRVTAAGGTIVRGRRRIVHPVRPASGDVSVRMQAGNAADPLMTALHGRGWRARAGVPRGRRPWHLATVAAAGVALTAVATRRPRLAAAATGAWAAATADLAWHRIAPGPRSRDEIGRMTWTSVVLPFAATWHWLRGWAEVPRQLRRPGPRPDATPAAVLFDRDGTLVHDVPYNGDPTRVEPVAGASEALGRLRAAGVPTAVITNQSGVARGFVTRHDVDAVNQRLVELLGPLGPVLVCEHGPDDGCRCRKPAPGLVEAAADALGVDPADCVVIGDIGSDVEAAAAAGARAILVPTDVTRPEEVAAAPEVATDLLEAVERALRPAPPAPARAEVSA